MAWIVLLGASLAVGALAVIRSDVFLAPAAAATARFQADHQIISRWIQRLADDPHIDQCLGISLFTINVLLFFGLARQYVARAVALVGARAFVPGFVLLLVALTDSRSFAVFQVVLLIAGLAWRHYLNNRSRLAVASASVAIGALCLVRIEVLLWTAAAAAISAAVFVFLPTAPSGSVARTWREVPKTLRMTLVGAAGFYLGSSPTLVYQATCSQNVFAVIRDRVLVNSVAAGAAPVTEKIATRLQQFWTENLLSQLPPYEISTPNVLLGLFAGLALTALLVHSVRSRRPHILLALVAVSLLLSIVTTGDLRYEHLLFLQLFVVLALLAGLRLAAGPRPGLVGAALLVVAVGNAATLYLDWRNWTDSVPVKQTMLNQSDPVALHAFLQAHYPGEEIWTTNVGLPNYLLYMSRGELSIHDIASWTTIGDTSDSIIDSGFGKQVSIPLQQMDKQRVIVAVSPVRDGSVGSIPRTRALYEILDWYQVPFHVDHVTSWRNAELYDIVVLDRGASPAEQGVLDVSVSSVSVRHAPGGGLVGSIAGEGFERGDVVMVDGVAPALTAFGSSESITFTVPGSERSTLTFQVFRPGTTKKSQVVSAPVQ